MNQWTTLLQNNDYLGAKKLLSGNADVNSHNEHEESVLALAIKYRCDDELIALLIEHGADIHDFDEEGVSIFDYAITYNNLPMVERLIEDGIDVNQTRRRSGFTPLMNAVCYGRKEIATLLINHGADKQAKDAQGFNAMDFARKMHKKSMLELLKR